MNDGREGEVGLRGGGGVCEWRGRTNSVVLTLNDTRMIRPPRSGCGRGVWLGNTLSLWRRTSTSNQALSSSSRSPEISMGLPMCGVGQGTSDERGSRRNSVKSGSLTKGRS